MPQKVFISQEEICSLIGISRSTWLRQRRAGKWPASNFVRIGRRILYPYSLLEELRAKAGNQASAKPEGVSV
jgi:hypothetical protein